MDSRVLNDANNEAQDKMRIELEDDIRHSSLSRPESEPAVDGSIEHSQPTEDKDPPIKPPAKPDLGRLRSLSITRTHSSAVEPPPNGGYGWVCAVAVAFVNAHIFGINGTYGIFLAYYLRNDILPGATTLDYAFVGSLSISVCFLCSPLATICTRVFGTRTTLLIGVAFETTSLITASFVKEIWQLYLSQGLCFAIGIGFLFVGSAGITPQWFTTKRSLANGIAVSGSGIGGMLYSLAVGAMIENIGLSWAFRVLGIIVFVVNTTCAILIRDRNAIIRSSQSAFDLSLLKHPEFWLLLGFSFLSMLAYIVNLFSLAEYATFIGLGTWQGYIVTALFNLAQAFGRVIVGYFSDHVGRFNMAISATFMAGLFALVIWIFADSFGLLIFYSLAGGFFAGTFWCVIAPLTVEVIGLKNAPSGLNLVWLTIVPPTTFSEPIALEIVKHTGSFVGTKLLTGFVYVGACMCLVPLRGWKVGKMESIPEREGYPLDIDAAGEKWRDGAKKSIKLIKV